MPVLVKILAYQYVFTLYVFLPVLCGQNGSCNRLHFFPNIYVVIALI